MANSQPIAPAPRMTTRAGHAVELERVVAGDDALAVDLEARAATAGTEPVASSDVPCASMRACRRPRPRSATTSLPVPCDDLDLAALHQAGEALVEPLDDLVLVGVDRGHVEPLERRR